MMDALPYSNEISYPVRDILKGSLITRKIILDDSLHYKELKSNTVDYNDEEIRVL